MLDDCISSKRPFAFISHISESKQRIEPILLALLKNGHALFVDRPHELSERFRPYCVDGRLFGIEGGARFGVRLVDAITHAAIFVPIISEEHAARFASSPGCRKELHVALENGVEILPVYLGEQRHCQKPFEAKEVLFQWPGLDERQWLPANPAHARFGSQLSELGDRFGVFFEAWRAKQTPEQDRDGWERQRQAADQWFDGAVRREVDGVQFVLMPGQDEDACFYVSSETFVDWSVNKDDLVDILKKCQKAAPGIGLPNSLELRSVFPPIGGGQFANPYHLGTLADPDRYWKSEDLKSDREEGWVLLTYYPM